MTFAPKALTAFALIFAATTTMADPLPSWNETEARQTIMRFVEGVTDPTSENYVTPTDRIAVFDNDGTLWSEQPVYFQLIFAIEQFRKMAAEDPSLITSPGLQAAVDGDMAGAVKSGQETLLALLKHSHTGLSVEEFQNNVRAWLDEARHPKTGLPYNQMTYQPMVELLSYLRDEGFKTYIVSGGGVHFMRVFAEAAYGIPTEQVIGTYTETSYQLVDGTPTIVKEPAIGFVDDKDGKPLNIDRIIGKRPIFAGGNSDGDYAMIEWTTAGNGPRFGLIVHHTDDKREVAYDCESHIGQLCDGLENGPRMGWLIVDMAKDWSRIYAGIR